MRGSECIVDVGSGSIGITVVTYGTGRPILSQTGRFPISSGTEEAKSGIASLAEKALETALQSIKEVGPASVKVVLAAPWYDAKIATISSKSEKQVKVTRDTVVRTVEKYLHEKGVGNGTGIESLISQLYVNGYPSRLASPVVGTALRVHHFSADADHAFAEAVRKTVGKVFPNAKVSLHSFMFAAFAAIRHWRDENNFLMIDIGSEITDVAIAHRDGLRFVGTFPVGTGSVIRAVANGKSLADARSRIALFAKGELSDEESSTFSTSFESAIGEWEKAFQSLLENAVNEVAIPQTAFLFGDPEMLDWLPRLVNASHGVFSSRAIPVVPDFFHQAVSLGDKGSYDSFLTTEAAYFNLDLKQQIDLKKK